MLVLETQRLLVRDFERSDAAAMNGVFGDEEVMRYGDGVKSPRWVRNWLNQCIENDDPNLGVSPWAVDEKSREETIGYCGLFYFPDICGQAEVEIGYRLARRFWGHGYATEAVCAVRDYAFDALGISRLIAMIDPGNSASINVAEKAEFSYEKDVMLPGYTHSDRVYVNVRSADVYHRKGRTDADD